MKNTKKISPLWRGGRIALGVVFAGLFLSSCTFGDFAPNREDLHNKGKDICQTEPDKCINGVPW